MERVYMIWSYHDAPRHGVADYLGAPHVFISKFNEEQDDYEATYELQPIDPETLVLAREGWQIWQRWERAFRAGQVPLSTLLALPPDQARNAELKLALAARLEALGPPAARARATFRQVDASGGNWEGFVVEWSEPTP